MMERGRKTRHLHDFRTYDEELEQKIELSPLKVFDATYPDPDRSC